MNIEELAYKHFPTPLNKDGEPMAQLVGHGNPHGFNKFKKAFSKGYKAAEKELPTWDDVRTAIEMARREYFGYEDIGILSSEEIIEQLKQSKQ